MPCGLSREPCGIVHVVMRATSAISSTYTTETDDGFISPCRLKFTTYAYSPSGEICSVAGKAPSVTVPRRESPTVLNFHSSPFGKPCAVET